MHPTFGGRSGGEGAIPSGGLEKRGGIELPSATGICKKKRERTPSRKEHACEIIETSSGMRRIQRSQRSKGSTSQSGAMSEGA